MGQGVSGRVKKQRLDKLIDALREAKWDAEKSGQRLVMCDARIGDHVVNALALRHVLEFLGIDVLEFFDD